MNLNEKLDNFYKSVIDSATAKSIETLDEYRNTLQSIRAERQQVTLKRIKNAHRLELDKILREKNRMLSKEAMDIKRKQMEHSLELQEQIFEAVSLKLKAYMATPSYEEYLVRKINDALDFARGDEMIIYINPSDESLIPALETKVKIKLTISNRDFFGGIRAVIPSRTILIDFSLQTKLAEAKANFKL